MTFGAPGYLLMFLLAAGGGVIVASAIMRRLLEGASVEDVHRFVSSLRAALDEM